MRITFLAISIALFLVACDGSGASGPADSSSSAVESSETVSSVTESSSSVLPLSSEAVSSSEVEPISSSLSVITSSSEQSSSSEGLYISYGTMTDERDGQVYKTVVVNKLTWMLENLNYAYLQPTSTLDSSSWCYGNNLAKCENYGRLYLWSAAMDSAALFSEDSKGCGYFATEEERQICIVEKDESVRGVCPEGWRLPTYNENFDLIMLRISGGTGESILLDYKLLDTGPFGYYNYGDDSFHYYPGVNSFWLAIERNGEKAYHDDFNPAAIEYTEGEPLQNAIRVDDKRNAYPVRCVKNESD